MITITLKCNSRQEAENNLWYINFTAPDGTSLSRNGVTQEEADKYVSGKSYTITFSMVE